jgi:signal transduction histidine kinase
MTAGVAALIERQQQSQPMGRPLLYGAIALSPFLLDVLDLVTPFRVRLPLWAFPIPVLVGGALLVSQPTEVDFAPFVFVFVTAEVASRSAEENRRWLGAAVGLASIGIMVATDIWGRYDDSFVWVIGISFGWFGGFLVSSLDTKTHELREAQEGLAEKAATDERQRIAREVHDVIAHSMSVTMLHVTAARMALERGRGPEALEALREAEEQGRRSLSDIRRTVGLLGSEESAAPPPMPTASDLPKLVSDFRSAGLDVTLSMDGGITTLAPAAGLNLYRVVQESLTNVVKHAPGARARVELNVTDDDIRLRIHNGRTNGAPVRPASGSGHGLRGMIERASMLGGSLATGQDEAGWTVYLEAPRITA